MKFFSEKIEQAVGYLEQQSPRDRMLALVVGVSVLLFVLYFGSTIIGGSFERTEGDNRDLIKQLAQIAQLQSRFESAREKVRRLERQIQTNKINLIPFLDQLSQKNGINISSMTPVTGDTASDGRLRERSVRLSITAAELGALVRFLDGIENSGKVVKVRQLEMRPNFSNPATPDFTATISTYELVKP